MSLSHTERLILQRRLAQLQRRRSPFATAIALGLAAVVLAPVLALVGGLAAAGGAYAALAEELDAGVEKIGDIEERELFETTRIYDRNGLLLRELFGEGKRTYIPLDEISPNIVEATVAVEDAEFYSHPGVDPLAIGRAVYGTLTDQPAMGGGSTITQQLVRHVAFSYEERVARSYVRKAKEIVLAVILTRQKDKDQVLEWYLNEIYYGNLAYGVEAAAKTVFGKTAAELSLAESALLAGLPKSPRDLDPLSPDPDVKLAVKRRQRTVLDLMVRAGYLTEREADAAFEAALDFNDPDAELFLAPHFVVHIEDLLDALVFEGAIDKKTFERGGLEITTTLDMNLQALAEREVREHVAALRERHDLTNAALVAMEPATGQILAMVGSADYWNDEIDGRVNVAMRERQPGSSIKPITYLTALERGMPSSQVIWDVPMTLPALPDYDPVNYDGTFRGPVRLRRALANSFNIPALKVLGLIPPLTRAEDPEAFQDALAHLPYYAGRDDLDSLQGVELTIANAHRMGIGGLQNDPWNYGLSLTLGGGEVTLLDMTNAYATLANNGRHVPPQAILRITDSSGEVLYDLGSEEKKAELEGEQAVDARAAYIITEMLSDNNARTPSFSPSGPLNPGVKAAAKTGTTNDYRDNWTMGYTPYLSVGVWAGNSDNQPMRNSSGITGAAPIWNAFMRNVAGDAETRQIVAEARERYGPEMTTRFTRPEGIIELEMCKVESLRQPSSGCPAYETELFIEDYAPEADDAWLLAPSVVVPAPPPPLPEGVELESDDPRLSKPPFVLCSPDGGHGADRAQPVTLLPIPEDKPFSIIGVENEPVVRWAAEYGWPTLYPLPQCSPEMAAAALEPGSLPTYALTGTLSAALPEGYEGLVPGQIDPAANQARYRLGIEPGAVLTTRTEITGTVIYNPDVIDFYKVELGPGNGSGDFFTIGDIHRGNVNGGVLEVIDAPSLPTGQYMVRLVLVKRDGNVLEPPHSVSIRIER